ncbi:hypothetical protein LCGC14_0657420 [marine sediment metagenome]|uniref:Uncharacterized protein n=1 Tax=marine sediment metagenome TaxID=412755 RepID=A0A0F9QZM2_9ZZZZ
MSVIDYRGWHKNSRIFVLGNGPSLRNVDLHVLDNEITFGVNRIWLHPWFRPMYFVAEARVLFKPKENVTAALQLAVRGTKFISGRCRSFFPKKLPSNHGITWLNIQTSKDPQFSEHCDQVVWSGMNVVFSALQLAFYMGATKVCFLGFEFSQVEGLGQPAEHWYSNELQRDQPVDRSQRATALRYFAVAAKRFPNRIVNATLESQVQCFPKVPLAQFLKETRTCKSTT